MTHEFGLVERIMIDLFNQLQRDHIQKVTQVYFRRGSAFSEESLRQAFQIFAAGSPVEDAELIIETINLDYTCRCGHRQTITSDDLTGHIFICPDCGNMHEIEEAHDLELVKVTAVQKNPDG